LIEAYRKNLQENIFVCIEALKQPYSSIAEMPVKRFMDLLKWKSQLEEEKAKMMEEKASALKVKRGKAR
jgi:hypothetical protein